MKQLLAEQRIAAVKLEGHWHFFAAPLVFFALDAVSFCAASVDSLSDFRSGLPQVDETNAPQFLDAMKPYEWEPHDIRQMSKETQSPAPLDFVIDFDTRTFVDNWVGDSLQDHVPVGWTGVAADPFEYVPAEVQKLWVS